jgi:hypothetical protein
MIGRSSFSEGWAWVPLFKNIILEVRQSLCKRLGRLDQYSAVATLEKFSAFVGVQSMKVSLVIPSKAAPALNPPFIAMLYTVYFHCLLVSSDTIGKEATSSQRIPLCFVAKLLIAALSNSFPISILPFSMHELATFCCLYFTCSKIVSMTYVASAVK